MTPPTTVGAELLAAARTALAAAGEPSRAAAQQRYMKSALPFHGVAMPEVRRIARTLSLRTRFTSTAGLAAAVRALWHGATHREERYVALELLGARRHRLLRTFELVGLYEELIVSGAWWDLIDGLAPARLAELQDIAPDATRALLLTWSRSDNLWLRRAAVLSQLKRKSATDPALLAQLIAPSLSHPAFFVQKAIGWALREYAYIAPAWVDDYVTAHGDRISALARREGTKHLRKLTAGADTVARPKRRKSISE